MPGRGPAPKAMHTRADNDHEQTPVEPDGELRGPDLTDSMDWPEETREWWRLWRVSPQAQTFTDTDWSFLLDTAVLHAEFWMGDRAVAAELRIRAAKFGATPEDRLRLRLSVGEGPLPKAKPKAKPRGRAVDRHARLLRTVDDVAQAG